MGLILHSLLTELLIFLVTILTFFYLRFKKGNAKYWSEKHIPHLPPKFFMGNQFAIELKKSFGEITADFYEKHKDKKVLGYWMMQMPVLLINDLDLIQRVLVRDFSYFHDRFPFVVLKEDPLSGNLFNLGGQSWRNMRVKLTPTFTTGKMKLLYPIMKQCGVELREYLDSIECDDIEIKDILSRFTTNIIGSCAFGIDTNALKNPESEFRYHGKRVMQPTIGELLTNSIAFMFPKVKQLFKLRTVPKDTSDFFINVVEQTMNHRKVNGIKRNDFLQLLIQLKEKGKIEDVDRAEKDLDLQGEAVSDTKFTLMEAAAQAFVFFVAGFETSSTAMTFALYELAMNQDVQQKLRSEIKKAIEKEGGNLSYEGINKIEYLEWVIHETLRKYPVVPVLMRQATKEYYLSEYDATLPKDQLIIIPLMGITRDPDIFPNPDKFDPTRFSPEEVEKRHSFSSIPFGEGPRNCIGNRFGLLQTKVGLLSLLEKYSVEPCEKTPKVLKLDPKGFVLTIEGGLFLKLVNSY